MKLLPIVVLTAVLMPLASAQSTRTEEIEQARQKKAAELKPEENTQAERALVLVQERRLIERFTYGIHGLRVRIGGLPTGQGFVIKR